MRLVEVNGLEAKVDSITVSFPGQTAASDYQYITWPLDVNGRIVNVILSQFSAGSTEATVEVYKAHTAVMCASGAFATSATNGIATVVSNAIGGSNSIISAGTLLYADISQTTTMNSVVSIECIPMGTQYYKVLTC